MEYSHYSEDDLQNLQHVFGHQSVSELHNILNRTDPDKRHKIVRNTLEIITNNYQTCMKYGSKPRIFKLTIGTEDLKFNHIVEVDVMYISRKPLIHIFSSATHFCAPKFLKKVFS